MKNKDFIRRSNRCGAYSLLTNVSSRKKTLNSFFKIIFKEKFKLNTLRSSNLKRVYLKFKKSSLRLNLYRL